MPTNKNNTNRVKEDIVNLVTVGDQGLIVIIVTRLKGNSKDTSNDMSNNIKEKSSDFNVYTLSISLESSKSFNIKIKIKYNS